MKVQVFKSVKAVKNGAKVPGEVYNAMQDYTSDLRAVSISRTPYRKGNLESSSTSDVTKGDKVVGEVGFLATNGSFNYAVKMHDGIYKLGEGSKRKKAKRSKYSNKSFKVGRKYLEDTAKSCKKGYTDDLKTRIGDLLE